MARFQNLSPDVWFLIVEQLNLADLYLVHQAFADMLSNADVASITTSQATKLLYQLLTSNVSHSEIVIVSDGAMCKNSCTPGWDGKYRHRPFNYISDMIGLRQRYIPISASAVTVTLSATNRQTNGYNPEEHGGEPLKLISAGVRLHPLYATVPTEYVALQYGSVDPETCKTTLNDVQQSSTSLLRTIGQEFHLTRAVWTWTENIPRRKRVSFLSGPAQIVKEQELPLEWFEFLGGKIRVEATLRKGFRVLPLNDPSPEEWSKARSVLRMTSISFENVALPTAKSLRQLFPKEITSLQDEESCQSN